MLNSLTGTIERHHGPSIVQGSIRHSCKNESPHVVSYNLWSGPCVKLDFSERWVIIRALNIQTLTTQIRSGSIDTVIVAFPDVFGRLIGKRFTGKFFLESVAK